MSSLSLKLPKAEKKYTLCHLKNLHTGGHSWNCADNINYTTALHWSVLLRSHTQTCNIIDIYYDTATYFVSVLGRDEGYKVK